MQKKYVYLLNYQIIQITGENVNTFLQGQLTTDIHELNDHNFGLTAYCNPQGRMWCIGRIWKQEEKFYWLLPTEVATQAITDLNKYAAFSKVQISIATEYCAIGMFESALLPDAKILQIDTERSIAIIHPDLLPELFKEWIEVLPHEWELAEIRAGIPNVWKETIGKLLPHDVNLPELQGVSFTKGCYKGQEIIAKMQYRGKHKKHLYYAQSENSIPIHPGDVIQDQQQKSVGEVISVVLNEKNEYELLVMLPDLIVKEEVLIFIGNVALQSISHTAELEPRNY